MALIDKASLLMVPSTYEQEKLYNVLPSGNRAPDSTDQNSGYDQTRADFTFDRGSNAAATRVNSDGLIEKYRENLLTESNNFSDSDWNVKAGTFTQGVEDPDGGNNAWAWTATNTDPYLYQSGKSLSGVGTLSIWVKGVGSTIGKNFELRNASTPYKNVVLTAEWQRVEHFNNTASGTSVGFEYGNPAVVGDVVHIYQAQYEVGTIATDYLDSGATTAKAGVLIDLPRINYDANGENGALLLEPQRANLIPYSEYFETWSNVNLGVASAATITTNYATSPDGSDNATRIQFDLNGGTSSSDRVIVRQLLSTATGRYFSVWMKSATGTDQKILWHHGGDDNEQTITNEWQRFELDKTSVNLSYAGLSLRGSTSSVDTADILVWGFQVEEGNYKTSYIPNHGTSGGVTRAADSCSATGVSDVIGQTEGTIYAEVNLEELSAENRFILTISNTSQSIAIFLRHRSSNQLQFYSAGLTNNFDIRHSITNGGTFKIAGAYKSGDIAFYIDGTQIGTDSSTFSTPSLTDARLGTQVSTGFELGGGIKESILFNERLSNAELAALTA